MNWKDYVAIEVTEEGPVATITILARPKRPIDRPTVHPELASALSELREDNGVRVIVLTGSDGVFQIAPTREFYSKTDINARFNDPTVAWNTFTAIIRCHQAMVEMEKPIVAKVNGDAIGFGSSLAFASDLIVAREDARFMDHHMGVLFSATYGGVAKQGGHDFSTVTGDGGASVVPLFMSPALAKEYLMLGRVFTGADLARLGLINYAVPAEALDAKVADLVGRLLDRGAHALGWAKRVANRRVADHLNLTLDAGVAYEMVSWLQLEKLDWQERRTLG